jgi:uncharacterized membrane protein
LRRPLGAAASYERGAAGRVGTRSLAGARVRAIEASPGGSAWDDRGAGAALRPVGRIPMKLLARWFVQGLVVLLPIVTTIWVLTNLFVFVDDLFPVRTPGLGFACAIVTTTIVGWLTSLYFGRQLVRAGEWFVNRIPVVKALYNTVKDVLKAIGGVGEGQKIFDRPVIVTLTEGGSAKGIGFVTREDLAEIGLPGEVAVLLQQSFNFAANLVIFPKSQVRPLPADASQVVTFIVSGGVTGALSAPATAIRSASKS